MVTPMTPWLHVRHALLMQATCDCAWLLTMPIGATMRGHRSLPLLDRSHYDPLEPCAPGEFRVFESVVVLLLFAFCLRCCNSDGRFATLFEICGYDCCDSSIEICFGKAAYIFGVAGRVWGVGGILDPGCSGRQIRGRFRSTGKMRLAVTEPSPHLHPTCGYHNQDIDRPETGRRQDPTLARSCCAARNGRETLAPGLVAPGLRRTLTNSTDGRPRCYSR